MRRRTQIAAWVTAILALASGCSQADMKCDTASGGVELCVRLDTAPLLQLNTPVVQTITVLSPDVNVNDVMVTITSDSPGMANIVGTSEWTVSLVAGVPSVLTTSVIANDYGYFATIVHVAMPSDPTNGVGDVALFDLLPPTPAGQENVEP